ncbi:unknown similar to AMEV140 [Choristoneura rosaceana entomopoxvirus 'L']|uniref:Viral late gene transcription factor 3 n=1 Tax=Choristoneura rosaceana entomopoxvirus 'L' TaxID=1293539 RepID=A0ABM9QKJ8_9POXV|nr:unknown similar to AMEV140 [Choristoneura rosaceana entomopoxvirus 'L']CCU56060.1 unknown similar to AMEV140 [Choristoneura rosaceana entomopoxvirus 'L']
MEGDKISVKNVFDNIVELFNKIEKKLDCNTCNPDQKCIHCIVCGDENCDEHTIHNNVKLNKAKLNNDYCIFGISVPFQDYKTVPSKINGTITITPTIITDKNKSYATDTTICLKLTNQYNLSEIISCIKNKLSISKFTNGKNVDDFDKIFTNISKLHDRSLYYDIVNNDIKIYLKKCNYSTINFICNDIKCSIKINTIIDKYKTMDEDLKSFLKCFKVTGLLLPSKVSFRLFDRDLNTKITWGVKLFAEFNDINKDNIDDEQSNYEDTISPSKCIEKLLETVKNLPQN